MKYSILLSLLLSLMIAGCHPSETSTPVSEAPSAAPQVQNTTKNTLPEPAESNKGNAQMIPQNYIDNQIHSYFRERKDETISTYYEMARKIVEKEKNIQKEIQVSSRRMNHFFVLGFSPDVQMKAFALDRNSNQPDNVYVVDLNKEKVISQGDFDSAFELYKSLDLVHNASGLSQDDINNVAKITSAIAFNTWDIMEDFIVGQKFPGDVSKAHIDIDNNRILLTFFINRTEMRMMFIRCKLTCDENGCQFSSESVL